MLSSFFIVNGSNQLTSIGRFFSILLFIILSVPVTAYASGEISAANRLTGVDAKKIAEGYEIRIHGSIATTSYTIFELYEPTRIIIDVAGSALAPGIKLNSSADIAIALNAKNLAESTPPVSRLEFSLPQSYPYTVASESNDIVIKLTGNTAESATTPPTAVAINALATIIEDIEIDSAPETTRILIKTNGKVSHYEAKVLARSGESSPRLYIDIDKVSVGELVKEQNVGTSVAKVRVAKRDGGMRVVLDSSSNEIFPYKIEEVKNGIAVVITEKPAQDAISAIINQKKVIDRQLPEFESVKQAIKMGENKQADAPAADKTKKSDIQALEDSFGLSGYTKQRISVDFFKIDIHNVFRLMREVSGVNIVVDESVKGSLTLALKDVPWDFALDIIINLMDLQKEERFNTIVITTKKKQFVWPERTEDNLSFDVDQEVVQDQAIIIQQTMNLPQTVIEAKKLIGEAKVFEKNEEFESAITKYKEAYEKWPGNSQLANIISSIYLVKLYQNANAVHYAELALQADPQNSHAALNAAIGLANMQNYKKAQSYFDQTVSGDKPPAEALLSYAVFSEEQKQFAAAVKLLKKHGQLYGDNLESMLAEARILDKQGRTNEASEKYSSILLSGFHIPPDLKKYINGRISFGQAN